MRELKQEDMCNMEVDLTEVRWQESDAKVLNAVAQEWGNSCTSVSLSRKMMKT